MKCKEAEINTMNIKSINVFREAQSSELSLWGLFHGSKCRQAEDRQPVKS